MATPHKQHNAQFVQAINSNAIDERLEISAQQKRKIRNEASARRQPPHIAKIVTAAAPTTTQRRSTTVTATDVSNKNAQRNAPCTAYIEKQITNGIGSHYK